MDWATYLFFVFQFQKKTPRRTRASFALTRLDLHMDKCVGTTPPTQVVRLLQSTEPGRLDLELIDGNLWLLQHEHARHHRRKQRRQGRQGGAGGGGGGGGGSGTTGMGDPHFRRVVMLLRALMGTRLVLVRACVREGGAGGQALAKR
jgi:uncharacterized membrane protein YgcG